LVFCKFGGRLETTLYIHFIRNWVETKRRSSAPHEKKDEKKRERTLFFAVGFGGFVGVLGGRHRHDVEFVNKVGWPSWPSPLTYWAGPLWWSVYIGLMAVRRVSVSGVGGVAAPAATLPRQRTSAVEAARGKGQRISTRQIPHSSGEVTHTSQKPLVGPFKNIMRIRARLPLRITCIVLRNRLAERV
jgi:hypothetical protein